MGSSTVLDSLTQGTAWTAVVLLAAAQGAMLLLVGFALAAALRGAAAATRHLLWSLVLVGVLVLPAASALVPWRLGVLPADLLAEEPAAAEWQVVVPVDAAAAVEAAPNADAIAPEAIPVVHEVHEADADVAAPVHVHVPTGVDAALDDPSADGRDEGGAIMTTATSPRAIVRTALAVWLAGALLLLARLLRGAAAMRGIVRRARPASETEWGWAMQRLADREGGGAPVRLLSSDDVAMPLTTGVLHPTIVLPTAARDWTPERRRAVLRHELAHVRRRDVLTHLLAGLACALHWPNPFAWQAARRMRAESERACDDLVLATGTRASEYAEHLLSIVRAAGSLRAPAPALPFAQRSDFEGRLLRILEPNVRRHGVTRGSAALVSVVLLVAAIPVAAMGPRAAEGTPASIGAILPETSAPETADAVAARQDPVSPTPSPTPTPTPRPQDPQPEQPETPRQPRAPKQPEMSYEDTGRRVSDAAIAGLIGALADGEAEVRRAAVGSLGELQDPRAVEALMRALRTDADVEVRKMSAWALGELEDERAVPALVEAVRRDESVEVRKMSAWALGQIESEAAVEALGAALGDGNPEVRETAVWALGEIESPASVRFIVPLLRDENVETRKQAAWALGQIESREAVAPLTALVRDANVEVRKTAVWALGEIEDPAAAEALAGALKDERAEVRRSAAWALSELDELSQAPPALIEALRDEDREVRKRAAYALSEIQDPAAVPALREAARSDDAELRKSAAHALAEIDDPAAFDALVEMLRDDDPEIRRLAAQALGRNH